MVINTNLLRKHVKSVVSAICTNVTYGEYDPDKDIPYAVLTLDDFDVGDREDKQLEINVYSDNVIELEDLADELVKLFKSYKYIDDNFLVFTKINSRNAIDDDKNKVKRRRLLIDLYCYDRSVS